jgi:hypothetical protein
MPDDKQNLPVNSDKAPCTSDDILRRKLQSYERSKPHGPREKQEYEALKRLQHAYEQLKRGEISGDEAGSLLQEVRARYPFIAPPPAWLPQEFAELIIAGVHFLGGDSGKREFLRWVQRSLPEPKGRPASDELTRIYKEAARMRQTLGHNRRPPSWAKITKKFCPQQKERGHECNKTCQDHIRLGATRYL